MEACLARIAAALRHTSAADLRKRTAIAYPGGRADTHFLGYHFAAHLAMHWGQIRTVRNLYRKSRGEPARFFPDNPTFPA